MQAILNKPIYDKFLTLCSSAKRSIKLCAPFIKSDIVSDILNVKSNKTRLDLITNVNLKSFIKNSSDVEAIDKLLMEKNNVYTFSKLHAKFYIFDNELIIITSANLTSSGLKHNYEYGILSDSTDLLISAVNDFNKLCFNELTGKVEKKHINIINKILSEIPIPQKQRIPEIRNIFNDDYDNVYDKNKEFILKNLSGWKKSVFLEVDKLKEDTFSTDTFKYFINNLSKKYPKNHNIEAKIRQQLQYLRDLGLIQFVSRGIYKKLWI